MPRPTDAATLFDLPPLRPATVDVDLYALSERLPTLRLGTSSWTFPGWRGWVYEDRVDKDILARDGLTAYARHPLLRTVSIDSTYYRLPEASVLERYASQVPADFRFVVKAPMLLTSAKVRGKFNPIALDAAWARDILRPRLLTLGSTLGRVLLQIPPQSPDAFGMRLYDKLAEVLSVDLPWHLEVRTPAWITSDLAAVIRDTGAVPTLSIHPALPSLRDQWRMLDIADAPELSIRWNLGHGLDYEGARSSYAPFDARVAPDADTLDKLNRSVRWALARERSVWVIANNKAEGCAPASLIALARAVGSSAQP